MVDGCVETKEVLLQKFYSMRPKANELLSSYANRLQDLLVLAMPSLKTIEQNIILRGQLATHLPDYMKALITFNHKTTWDELLTALDAAHPYVNKMESAQYKSDSVDVNTLDTAASEVRRCFICNETGHLKRNCHKNKYKDDNNRNFNNRRGGNWFKTTLVSQIVIQVMLIVLETTTVSYTTTTSNIPVKSMKVNNVTVMIDMFRLIKWTPEMMRVRKKNCSRSSNYR